MINNNLEALVHELKKGDVSQAALWTTLVIVLDDFHARIERLEEIERERCLMYGDPTAERPCEEIAVKMKGNRNERQ